MLSFQLLPPWLRARVTGARQELCRQSPLCVKSVGACVCSLLFAFFSLPLTSFVSSFVPPAEQLLEFMHQLPAFANMTMSVRRELCAVMVFAVVERAGTIVLNDGEEVCEAM